MPPTLLEQLAKELEARLKHNTPAGTPSTPYMHGPGGLWSTPGLERDIISTRLHPRGLASAIPARGTVVMNPLFPYLTGYLDNTGTDPATSCDDPKVAGPMKNCYQTAQFGLYGRMTREIDITQVNRLTDRGEFTDLTLMNDPLLEGTNTITTPGVPGNADLRREVLQRFIEVGISFQNLLSPQLYTGNPANNNVGGGYKEFPGLDILIGTTKIDALTGQACPSLRSTIKSFNYKKVDSTASDADIVNLLTYTMRDLQWIADRTNLSPVQWVFAMRPQLFYELTAVWPCAYLTHRCASRADGMSQVLNMDAGDQITMRDNMRNGKYLLIDGVQFPVVLDDAIVEEHNGDNVNINAGCFASDIYIIPMSVRGLTAATYWEYVDYTSTAMQAAADGQIQDYFWTDGGRFLWHKKPPKNWCAQWVARIEPRVILRTPHLAARITDVQYCPLTHERDVFPTDPYFVDGGVTSRSGPSLYSDWNTGQ